MFLKFKNYFKSWVWEHLVLQAAFHTETIDKNLLWVNGVGTVVAKDKDKGMKDI